jgi:O-antigen/teichoic acid export membrane protein
VVTVSEPGREIRSIARGGLLNLFGAGVSVLVNLGMTVAITRTSTRQEAGRFFAATSLFLLVESVVISGATTGVIYFVARSRARRQYRDVQLALRYAAAPVVVASLVVAALTPLWAPWSSHVLGNGDAVPSTALIVLLAGLPLAAISDTALAATTGYRTMRPTVAVERLFRPALQGVLVLIVLPTHNPTLVVAAWVAPYLFSAVAAVVWLRRLIRLDPAHNLELARPDPSEIDDPVTTRTFWSYTAPRGVAGVAAVALQRLDIVLVGALSGAADAALYTAATRFLVVGQLIAAAIGTSVQPRLAGWFAVRDLDAVASTYRTATAWVVLISWPFYLICAWTAPFWLEIFGSGYNDATSVVLILAASMLLATGTGMVSVVLVMGGRTKDNMVIAATALGVNVGIDVALIPRIGIVGAAIGWAVAIVVNNLVPLRQIWRQFSIHPGGPETLRSAGLAVACLGVVPSVAVAIVGFSLASAVVGCAVGALGFTVVVICWYPWFGLSVLKRPMSESTPAIAAGS